MKAHLKVVRLASLTPLALSQEPLSTKSIEQFRSIKHRNKSVLHTNEEFSFKINQFSKSRHHFHVASHHSHFVDRQNLKVEKLLQSVGFKSPYNKGQLRLSDAITALPYLTSTKVPKVTIKVKQKK
jgi:hypothetical protein